ncbi:MAG: SpoIID/LytB domain-containing protein [Chitinivibrionales bacterium]
MAGCSGLPFLVPNPGGEKPSDTSDDQPVEDAHDFGSVFDSSSSDTTFTGTEKKDLSRFTGDLYRVGRRVVRIALGQHKTKSVFYSAAPVKLASADASHTLQGRIEVVAGNKNFCRISSVSVGTMRVALPCTLKTSSINTCLEVDGKTFRGHMGIIPQDDRRFTVVNMLPVEHYLRGVVPLEIGRRPESEIEAVKAQAVAARTYTYGRMLERSSQPWDMLPTVNDQVYGGVDAEDRVSDKAIAATLGEVLVYGKSLIDAYYHSTCGGKTANIEDVWGKPPQPYLVSIEDVNQRGEAYCRSSRYYTWTQRWNTKALTSILHRYAKDVFPAGQRFDGNLSRIRIEERFNCGRIRSCAFFSSRGTYRYGTDKIRFAMRRDAHDAAILRSSNFSLQTINYNDITITGRGYGHGVGMCQVGAMGRAREGQNYEQILTAYYTGTRLATVTHQP